MAVDPGYQQPIKFKGIAYIRVESSLQPLGNHTERERAIWAATSRFAFEQAVVKTHANQAEIVNKFACVSLLKGLGLSRITDKVVLDFLTMEGLVRYNKQGGFDVTNSLAIAAANNFRDWSGLERKGPRVIHYKGKNKLEALGDVRGQKGYGVIFPLFCST